MAASEPNDAVPPSELMEAPPNMSSETAAVHILSWKESLQYTCRKNATLMATPQVVVETIHSLSQSGPMQYHIADVPSQLAISSPGMEDSVTASQTKRDEFVTFIRQQLRDSIVFAEKQQNAGMNSSVLATNSKTQFLAMALHPFWTFLFLISFLWNQTSAPLKALAHQLMQFYLQNANDYSEDILDANEPNALPLCLTTSSSSQECEGILKAPGDPVILSALRQRSTELATATPSFSSLITPSRLFLQDQVTPDGSRPTNVAWNESFVSVSLLLEALQYIRNQLYQRRQAYLTQRDPAVDTVISVHAIRKWLHPPVENDENDAIPSPSKTAELTSLPSNGSLTERLSSPRSTPPTASIDEANATPVAKFLEQISDSQLEWLLSFITTTTTTAEEPSADKDVCLLQRLDRESHSVSGGSVYILQLPNETIETRLAFYDVQQSIATIQANIAQWESTLSEIQKDILVERQTASTTNPSPKLLRLLQRYKLYRQHKEQGEATLLNLYSVQCSLEHTVQVQRPTVAALQQTKLAMQSLRPKDPDALEELVDEIRELEDNDPLDILCQKETHMDTDEMQQLQEELLELQLQDLPCAPSGFPKANTPSFNENPDVGTDAIQPCT